MKLSEMIEILEEALSIHGDLETREGVTFGPPLPIGDVRVHPSIPAGGLVLWLCQSRSGRHRHTRACYDDAGPGHGSPPRICGKVEGYDSD